MKEFVCIVCPRGCHLKVDDTKEPITVTGNTCKRGAAFGISEVTCPMRTICTTVRTSFPEVPVLPVRVSAEIPKDRIFDVMKEINRVVLTERVGRSDVIVKNILGLGVDLIATSDMMKWK